MKKLASALMTRSAREGGLASVHVAPPSVVRHSRGGLPPRSVTAQPAVALTIFVGKMIGPWLGVAWPSGRWSATYTPAAAPTTTRTRITASACAVRVPRLPAPRPGFAADFPACAAGLATTAMVRETSRDSGKLGGGLNARSMFLRSSSSAIDLHLRCSHRGAQALQRPVDARLDAGHRDPERDRDLVERHVEVKVQEDGRPFPKRQVANRSAELIAIEPRPLIHRARGEQIGKTHDAPPRVATDFAALVGDDAHEPRSKRAVLAQVAEPTPCPQGSLLNCVLSLRRVAEHREGQPAGRPDGRDQQVLESPVLALLGARDQ